MKSLGRLQISREREERILKVFILPVQKRSKTKLFNEGATAGAAKVSSGGKGREELKSLGERNGWADQELTGHDVVQLSADHCLWFSTFFPDRLEHAAQLASNKRHNKVEMKKVEAQQFWNRYWGTGTQAGPEEATKVLAELERFTARYPQFLTDRSENSRVLEYLKDNDFPVTYQNLVHAFEACVLSGSVVVSPARIGAGSEEEVTGDILTRHRNVRVLMSAQSRPDDVSADDFYRQHKELHPGTPFLIRQREAQKQVTEQFFEQARAARAQAGSTSLTDYGERTQGVPPEPDRVSFRKKIASMSADAIRLECEMDPAFRKALDNLK
jgi:hypothetical protein